MMRKIFGILFLTILVAVKVTAAQQNLSFKKEDKPAIEKDRMEMFKRTLAYLPAILLSTINRIQMSHDERIVFEALLKWTAVNLNLSEESEYVKPDNYKIFKVIGSKDQSKFKLSPDEKIRTAVTGIKDIREPIYVNELIVNDLHVEISLPEVVQILLHEVGRKMFDQDASPAQREHVRNIVDTLTGKIKKVLSQDHTVISLNKMEKLHILNAPVQIDMLPKLGMDTTSDEYKAKYNIFELQRARWGREVLIFHEGIGGFTYVPTLKPALLKDIKNMNPIGENNKVYTGTLTNIEEIRVERSVDDRPVVRFIMNVQERAYRISEETKDDKPTGAKGIMSISSTNTDDYKATDGDEVLSKREEVAVRFKRKGEVDVSRRPILTTEARIQVKDFIWKSSGDEIIGSFKVDVPASVKNILNWDLRAFLYVRLDSGVNRIEVTRMDIEKDQAKFEFKIPSAEFARGSFFVEEILLKNKSTEVLIDLPDTIRVKASNSKKAEIRMAKFERELNGKWSEIKLIPEGDEYYKEVKSIKEIDKTPGIIKFPQGEHKFRMAFRSDTPLNELYFYMRANYLSHDPMVRSTYEGMFKKMGMFGEAILGSKNSDLTSLSVAYSQAADEIIYIPASKMKQTRSGAYIWVEFTLPMYFLKDKGPNTFDMGLRYFGEIVALNQRMERWRTIGIGGTLFALEGSSYGLKSCQEHFK